MRLTETQLYYLRKISEGGWRAGRTQDVTMPAHRTLNLGTARAFQRRGLLESPASFGSGLVKRNLFPGDPLELTQAGIDLLIKNRDKGEGP